ncbi:hypothetical protein NDU88_009528 [Pleurodeles waltl]|uniref:Uncharacterized protein n=1 Tax=Pleurodeles waltl TaxID=8319 RepID=A0AAV7PTI3_PLEWA|nr:hypothetical protein NDU88_009528 [Pleurodeles waltl]
MLRVVVLPLIWGLNARKSLTCLKYETCRGCASEGKVGAGHGTHTTPTRANESPLDDRNVLLHGNRFSLLRDILETHDDPVTNIIAGETPNTAEFQHLSHMQDLNAEVAEFKSMVSTIISMVKQRTPSAVTPSIPLVGAHGLMSCSRSPVSVLSNPPLAAANKSFIPMPGSAIASLFPCVDKRPAGGRLGNVCRVSKCSDIGMVKEPRNYCQP